MNYKLADWVNIGTNFTAITRSYNLSENNAYLTKSTNEIYGYLQFNLKKSFLIQTKVGYSMWRSFESFNNDEKVAVNVYGVNFGDHRTVLNPAFKDGLIFKARLIYRFYIKQ